MERRLGSGQMITFERLGGFTSVPVPECACDSTGTQGSRQVQFLKISLCLLLPLNEMDTLFFFLKKCNLAVAS